MPASNGDTGRVLEVREYVMTFVAAVIGLYEAFGEHSAHVAAYAFALALFSGATGLAARRLQRTLKTALEDDDEPR